MIAGGESGLPFYNPQFLLQESSYIWSNELLGGAFPTSLAGLPFYFVLAQLSLSGIPGIVLEAGTFWLILATSSVSVYKLTFLATREQAAATVAGLFYILNPFALTEIWNRLILTQMFAYALMPLALFLYLKGIETRQTRYVAYFGGSTILYSFAFSSLAVGLGFWALIFLAGFALCIVYYPNRKVISTVLKVTVLDAILFFLFNAWWLAAVSTILLTPTAQSGQSPLGPDLGTLFYFASKSTLTNVMRLMPSNWSDFATAWGQELNSPVVLLISFMIPLISYSSLLYRPYQKRVLFYSILGLGGLILANGAAPPIGGPFLFLYERLPFAVLFRNPFEKLGLLYMLAISPLFGIGITCAYRYLRSLIRSDWLFRPLAKYSSKIVSAGVPIGLTILVLGIVVWPMWTGAVFEGTSAPNPGNYVQVPSYYADARQWLESQGNDFRVLVLPLRGEATTYIWSQSGANLGFSGVNIDNLLFGVPSVSLPGASTFGQTITGLPGVLVSHAATFWKIMSVLSAKYAVVREDSNYTYRGEQSPGMLEQAFETSYLPSTASGNVDLASPYVKSLYDTNRSGSLASLWVAPIVLNFSATISQQSDYGILYNAPTAVFAQGYSAAGLTYFLPRPFQNFSQARFLEAWVRVDQSVNVSIGIANSDGSSIDWGSPLDNSYSISSREINGWKLFVVPIPVPSRTYKSFNINSSVVRIGFGFFGPPESVPLRAEVGGIFVDRGVPTPTPHIHFLRSFGKLHLYELDEGQFVPMIYAATQFVSTETTSEFLDDTLPNSSFVPGQSVALMTADANSLEAMTKAGLPLGSRPELQFRSVSPVRYEISAMNATGPFVLVLNQFFDSRWMASYKHAASSPTDSKRLDSHFEVNGFANGWFVPEGGNLTITLHFEPQDFAVYGSWISFSSFVASIGVLAGPALYSAGKNVFGRQSSERASRKSKKM
jgi:hypothetical protein